MILTYDASCCLVDVNVYMILSLLFKQSADIQIDVDKRANGGVVRGLRHGVNYTELLVGAVIINFNRCSTYNL